MDYDEVMDVVTDMGGNSGGIPAPATTKSKVVTDPELIKTLNSKASKIVTNPELIKKLNEKASTPKEVLKEPALNEPIPGEGILSRIVSDFLVHPEQLLPGVKAEKAVEGAAAVAKAGSEAIESKLLENGPKALAQHLEDMASALRQKSIKLAEDFKNGLHEDEDAAGHSASVAKNLYKASTKLKGMKPDEAIKYLSHPETGEDFANEVLAAEEYLGPSASKYGFIAGAKRGGSKAVKDMTSHITDKLGSIPSAAAAMALAQFEPTIAGLSAGAGGVYTGAKAVQGGWRGASINALMKGVDKATDKALKDQEDAEKFMEFLKRYGKED